MPQEQDARERIRASQARLRQSVSASAPAAAPQEKPWSVGGFAENVLDDATELLKGIAMLPVTAFKAGVDIAGDPKGVGMLFDQPEHLGSALGDTAKAVGHAIIEPYQKHGAGVVYHRPLTVVLDGLTAVSLGSTALVRAGKLAGVPRLIEMGEALGKMPGRMARQAIDTGVKRVTGIDLAKRRGALELKAEEMSQVPIKVAEDMERVGNDIRRLTDAEAETFHRWRTQGASAAEVAASPNVGRVFDRYRQLVETVWQTELKARGLLDDGRIMQALAKKYAAEAGVSVEEALARIKAAQVKPVYGPAIVERKRAFGIDEFFDDSPGMKGKVGFLEEFKTGEGAIRDPREYIPRAIRGFREVEANLRWVERIIQNPEFVKAAVKAAGSERLPTQGILKRYFEDKARAQAAAVRDLFVREGPVKARDMLARDAATRQRIAQSVGLVADPTIKRLLDLSFKSPPHWVRIYDRVLGLWRRMVTIWNPRFYVGQVFGDALLGTLAGSDWLKARALLKQGPRALPPQVMGGGGMAGVAEGGFLEKASDIANMADQATRAGIITKAARDEIVRAGFTFEQTAELLEPVIKSQWQFSELQVRVQLVEEQIARRSSMVEKLDREIVAKSRQLKGAEGRAAADVSAAGTPLKSEAQILRRIEQLEAKRVELIAKAEADKASRAVAIHEVKKLTREGIPGVAKRLAKAMRQEERAKAAFYVDVLRDLRQRGIRVPESLASEAHRIPKQFRRADGVMADELAQELADRGIIHTAAWDDLADFLDVVVDQVRGSRAKADPRAARSQARNLVARTGGEGLKEIISTTDELARLKRQLREGQKLQKAGAARVAEIQAKRAVKSEELIGRYNRLEQEVSNLATARQAIINDLMENSGVVEKLLAREPALRAQVDIARKAVARGNAFTGDYIGLGPIEQGVFRRVIPFYPWLKAMNMLAFRLPFLSPVRTFLWHRYSMAVWSMIGDHELPETMQGYVPVGARETGELVWLRLSTATSPFGGVRKSKVGNVPIPAAANVVSQNPFLSLGFRVFGGRTEYDVGAVPYGEPWVNLTNGDLYELTDDGNIRKTVSQTPLVQGLAHLFPITQMVEQMLTPYEVNQFDQVGLPKPVLNTDGSFRYPREWWQTLVSMSVGRVTERKREDVIRGEKLRVRSVILGLRAQYRRADPEKREMIRQVMEDYQRGEFRRIGAR